MGYFLVLEKCTLACIVRRTILAQLVELLISNYKVRVIICLVKRLSSPYVMGLWAKRHYRLSLGGREKFQRIRSCAVVAQG